MLELLGDGLEIALFGMAAVFILLGCLVLALNGMSRVAAALDPAVGSAGLEDHTELTVAIAAAIHMHRGRRR